MRITIDGPDGLGKTTISKKLAEELGFAYIHFPYYENETGQKIIDMLNHKIPWDALTFQCLQTCNRIQTIKLLEDLEKEHGGIIIDRNNPSTIVYGKLDGLSEELLETLISVLPKSNMEIIILADKPYRLNGDFYEDIEKWKQTKELYLEYYARRKASQCVWLAQNEGSIEECIAECKRLIKKQEEIIYRIDRYKRN